MFFYDEKGSKLFEKITQLPEYYLTRTEIPLIKQAAQKIGEQLTDFDIVEFGSGDCSKISLILQHIPQQKLDNVCYIPIDISSTAITQSADLLLQQFPDITIQGIVADFMTQLHLIPHTKTTVFCFLGSTIGNFSMKEAVQFLNNIRDHMDEDDLLLVGFDMQKNKTILEKAYNDSQQITKAFNKNILNVINTQIGTDFDPEDFTHVAFYNERLSRIEMHLKATQDIQISCPLLSSAITLNKDETIHTENSYKFSTDQIEQLAKKTELFINHCYTDDQQWFSLVEFKKR